MEQRLITYPTAELAKYKGFNLACYTWYNTGNPNKILTGSLHNHNHPLDTVTISAPPQSILQKWLRDRDLHIEVLLSDNRPWDTFYYRVMRIGRYFTLSHDGKYFPRYEDALEAGLFNALNQLP